ncbi:hypothetical protein [Roseateles sp. PN1]|uniref:hypothetical protein n=1 Tax=Roseateles sp. PN1 TaxID=3137372 RepID=UPI00313A2478
MSRASRAAFAPSFTYQPPSELEVPSGRGFIALLEAFRATGGTAPADVLARLLEEYQLGRACSLAQLVHTGQVFGFEWRSSLWIPMFQFEAQDLALKAEAQEVRAALPQLWSGWAVAAWFAGANAHLAQCRPVDVLASDFEAVRRAASAVQSVGGFIPVHGRRAEGHGLRG